MSRILIALGLILGAIGLLWRWIERLGLGRLPGDVVIEHNIVCVGIDTLTNPRQETSFLTSQFMLPQLSHRSKIDAQRFETFDASAG